jgi:predicted transposase YdaD
LCAIGDSSLLHHAGFNRRLEQGREEGVRLFKPIIKEIHKGELTHEEIAVKFSISVEAVNKLAEELK